MDGQRVGFRVSTLRGEARTLAHTSSGLIWPYRVGCYTVDVEGFEALALPTLTVKEEIDLYLVDEIGKMECLSGGFRSALEALFEAKKPLVATVAQRGGGFIQAVKEREEVELWLVTRENRESALDQALTWVTRWLSRCSGQ